MPAFTSTASCRVATATSSALTRPPTQRRTLTSGEAALACFSPVTSVRKRLSRRSTARSVRGESASLSPSTLFPLWSSALYAKTGMGGPSDVFRRHREDLGRGGLPLGHLVGAVL